MFTVVLIFLPRFSTAQPPTNPELLQRLVDSMTELEFELALTQYVDKLFVDYGVQNMPREKYLVAVMRLVNQEMRKRIVNPRAASNKYFSNLYERLDELQQLKSRLEASGINELDAFVDELGARMKLTIRTGEVNYKKQRVFEDALQLLYVAEEMIKLDQLREPGSLNKKISSSKDKLLGAFGEVGSVEDVPLDTRPTIFDLYEEWKKSESSKFTARLLDVQIVRSKLIKSGSLAEIARMFNSQLRVAYNAFNYNDYDIAERLLEDLVETYAPVGVRDFEDVFYYWAESNFALSRLLRARDLYTRLIQQYPNTAYLSRCYSRLIQIAYKLENTADLLNTYSRYQNVASPGEKDYYDIQFIAALTMYQTSDFNRAVDILSSFPQNSPYFYLAKYLIGTIYAAGQNYEMAETVFLELAEGQGTPIDIYSRVHYKLALLQYEKGSYLSAIEHLSLIPENYVRYDKVLNALAWSFFMAEQSRPVEPEQRDYSMAIQFANRLTTEFYASEHRMEAESLLGYIYQTQKIPGVALNHYRDVYESKAKKKDVEKFLEEREQLEQLQAQAQRMKEKAMRSNNPKAYVKASDLADNLQAKIYEMDLTEMSSVGSVVSHEIQSILGQMEKLSELKERAEKAGNQAALAKIDSVMIRLSSVLDMFPEQYLQKASSFNWFDAYPISRKVAEYKFRMKKNREMRAGIGEEFSKIDALITGLMREIEREKLKKNFKAVVELEQQLGQLTELRKKYDRLYTATFQVNPGQPYAEFDQWGDFGAFGVIDVNFGQRSRLQNRMAEVSRLHNSVADIVNQRREKIEDKFKKIEAEIRFMTMKARLEERVRLRAERERSFRETYFDKRTSEFEDR